MNFKHLVKKFPESTSIFYVVHRGKAPKRKTRTLYLSKQTESHSLLSTECIGSLASSFMGTGLLRWDSHHL